MSTFRVDWLSITIFGEVDPMAFWGEFFAEKLGQLTPMKHGGRGFHEIYSAVCQAKLYLKPVTTSAKGEYFHIELPGTACACLTPGDMSAFWALNFAGLQVKVTRIDLAFDNPGFSPNEFYQYVCNPEQLISRASRDSITFYNSPFQAREDGSTGGCQTVYIGSRESERMVRVYNLHGFDRLELELKGDWAHVCGSLILGADYSLWMSKALSFVKQFIDFRNWIAWEMFLWGTMQSDIVVKSARVVSINRVQKWLAMQAVPAIFAVQAVMGFDEFWEFVCENITDKRIAKYKPFIEMVYKTGA